MDSDLRYPAEFSETTVDEDAPSTDRAFFLKAQDFVVAGGTFTSISHVINQTVARDIADFRVIPLGDLDLLHNVGSERASVVVRRERASTRKMYAVRIPGSRPRMTAAVFQGRGTEEVRCRSSEPWKAEFSVQEWREEVSRYSNLRHPHIIQLYGVVNTQGLHAAIFHDDLIPYKELQKKYHGSQLLTAYFWASLETVFSDVSEYMLPFLQRTTVRSEYTVWIRSSTGRPCLELTPPRAYCASFRLGTDFGLPSNSLLEPPADSEIIASMALKEYHAICYMHVGRWSHVSISTNIPVRLGSIRHFPTSEYENSFEIASVSGYSAYDGGWATRDPVTKDVLNMLSCYQEGTLMMENGWIRVDSAKVADAYCSQIQSRSFTSWLAQANNMFGRLGITCDLENYACIDTIKYWLTMSEPRDALPSGYLFLCPSAHFESDLPGCFRIPDCAAYWSLDASGMGGLREDEARTLGFQDIQVHTLVLLRSWDDSVYAEIRQFQEAKGVDPFSQAAAIAMGCPILQPSCDRDALAIHLQETDLGGCSESAADDAKDAGPYFNSVETSADDEFSELEVNEYGADAEVGSGIFDLEDDKPGGDVSVDLKEENNIVRDSLAANPVPRQLNEEDVHWCGGVDEAYTPSSTWTSIMVMQLMLVLIATVFSLYDY
ncbi:hypothetical protein DFH06DRAFT_1485565 [Mycena polygramma]|nr:hypothetical protein DFH06DRAFT_1485565 [Mycena polygramma]